MEMIGRSNTVKHYQTHADQKKKKNKDEAVKSVHNGLLQCSTCLKEFVDKQELQDHEEHYHIERKFMCAICNKCFVGAPHFYLHMTTHGPIVEPLKCTECDFTTSFPIAYSNHLKSHPRLNNPFMCQFCGACFIYRKDLNAHKRSVHTKPGITVFQCKLCLKEYSRKIHLQHHINSAHLGQQRERRICDICGKSISQNKLNDHIRIHEGLRPHACTYCDKRFTARKYLRDHIRVHTGEKPFICQYCGKGFSQKTPLNVHLRSHTGETPYVCQLCNRGFVSKSLLDNHLKNEYH